MLSLGQLIAAGCVDSEVVSHYPSLYQYVIQTFLKYRTTNSLLPMAVGCVPHAFDEI